MKQAGISLILVGIVMAVLLGWSLVQTYGQANYDRGLQQGKTLSYQDGYSAGKNDGWANGNFTGFEAGYAAGQNSGYELGRIAGNQSGFTQGQNLGYQEGYGLRIRNSATTGYNIRDPSYQEMIDFISADQTDKKTYNETAYNCYDFSSDVCSNSFKAGIRAGSVYIEFPVEAHEIVCFNTIDEGLVFIEPQTDAVVPLHVGQHYWDRAIYEAPSFDDTIVSYNIIW